MAFDFTTCIFALFFFFNISKLTKFQPNTQLYFVTFAFEDISIVSFSSQHPYVTQWFSHQPCPKGFLEKANSGEALMFGSHRVNHFLSPPRNGFSLFSLALGARPSGSTTKKQKLLFFFFCSLPPSLVLFLNGRLPLCLPLSSPPSLPVPLCDGCHQVGVGEVVRAANGDHLPADLVILSSRSAIHHHQHQHQHHHPLTTHWQPLRPPLTLVGGTIMGIMGGVGVKAAHSTSVLSIQCVQL